MKKSRIIFAKIKIFGIFACELKVFKGFTAV